MARRRPLGKVTYFEPVPPRLARNTITALSGLPRQFAATIAVRVGD